MFTFSNDFHAGSWQGIWFYYSSPLTYADYAKGFPQSGDPPFQKTELGSLEEVFGLPCDPEAEQFWFRFKATEPQVEPYPVRVIDDETWTVKCGGEYRWTLDRHGESSLRDFKSGDLVDPWPNPPF